MAKIKVHELAKELDKQSKDVISFLKEKGIEAKTASSGLEENEVEMIRNAFGKKAEPADKLKAAAETVESSKESSGEAVKEDAPKKKKKIIFVSNPQNSKMPGQRSNDAQQRSGGTQQRIGGSQGGARSQNGYHNAQNRGQAPVRPIKPLTPPSPTPSVQMHPDITQQQSRRAVQGDREKKQAEMKAAESRGAENQTAVNQTVEKIQPENQAAESRMKEQSQTSATQAEASAKEYRYQENRGQNRTQDRNQNSNQNSNQERGQNRGQNNFRNRDGRPAQGQRPQGENGTSGQYQQNRGGQGQRPQGGQRSQGGQRPQGDQRAMRDRRSMTGGFGGGRDGARPGQGGQFRDNRQSKSFVGEAAPAKDMEKKREEDKRRLSQEKDKRSKKDYMYEEDEALKNKPGRFIKPEKRKEEAAEEVIKVITLPESITIKDLADKMKLQPAAIVKKLFLEGKVVTVNQEISYEDAENIAMEYEILCEKEVKVDVIEELLKEEEEDEENLVERPPVICVMGHVDHGKTSLLDAIRKTNVTDREAGGITQHIGAYTVTVGERKITFLDTPGHEAFTAMRMRGANSTDIAILVVAADDGVMPQTVEAINHAKAAGIEIIVAVNKIDKPSANIDRVKQELTEYELVATDWGGSTEFVPVSAKSGEGIEDLLETILLTADILELKANPKRRARGLVIEAELDKGRGPVATVLVQKGVLHVGDFISAGASHGKVRAMVDDKGRRVREAGPSTPVEILGLSDVPSAGEVFIAHENDKSAKNYAETYMAQNKEKMLEETKGRMSLDELFSQIQEGNLKELNLIVKADVQGSVEAVKQSLMKLSNEEVVVKCIHGGVGAINESDVTLASASNAIIIGFNVRPDATAKATAEREGVDVRLYKVIYQAIEDIEAAMKGMLDPVYEEKVIGHAEVRQLFKASAIGNIAGSYVLDGVFQKNCKVRITREGEQIFEGELASLKRFKDDVKEVKAGFECGLVFEGFDQMQELDIVEAYIMVEVPR